MIEYKAYHKKSLGRRKRLRSAPPKKKRAQKNAGRVPVRQAAAAAAVIAAVLLLGWGGAAAYERLTRSEIFSVRIVDVNPCSHVSGDEIAGILRGVPRGNIWSLSKEAIGRRILSHPYVRDVAIRKVFPDTLIVRIEEREPVAMINLDALYYVDERGTIFKRLTAYDPKDLPILTGFSRADLAAGDPVTMRNLRRTIALLHRAEDSVLSRNISEIHFDAQDGYTVVTRDYGLSLKIGTMDFGEAIRRIDQAMPKLARLGQVKGVVDLKTAGRIFVRPED
jgi:cell division protein FtsQ